MSPLTPQAELSPLVGSCPDDRVFPPFSRLYKTKSAAQNIVMTIYLFIQIIQNFRYTDLVSLNFSGSVSLTSNWKIGLTGLYRALIVKPGFIRQV